MNKLHPGKLYLLSNPHWQRLKKIGVAKIPKEQIKNMQIGLHETSVLKQQAYENRISLLKKKSYDFESGVSNFGEIFKKKDEITKLRELYLQP